ncbi:RNA pseudouridine synthase [Massilia solisilvae]|uniref:Dual-specificity RNA pseudouridine synthase RluF n=1 Tax=Massilia solisilvae TaxID=1811225 RepID=A0ABT2BFU0_9BURK|nr:RNA pseudouridine synthase [Massilia solisilvae]MCS0607391.1 RNA pseudouridine synthase [Massilia solisilvae]
MADEGVRLAKRIAAQVPCSRAEAERYIAGGWVSVDGTVVEDPATRVTDAQTVALLQGATAVELAPVTILLHKPAGFASGGDGRPATDCLTPENLEGRERFLKRHLAKLTLAVPLETSASGLVVYTQNYHVARKLVDEADRFEQEYVADVTGKMPEGGLALLNRGLTFEGKATGPLKASWQSENRLRFAGKGIRPGQVEHMCRAVGLEVVALKRLRIGRVPLAGLPERHWRYLNKLQRF